MKDFFKTMFASALGVLVAIGVCIIAFIAVVVSMIAHVNQVSDYQPKANTILKISLSGIIQEDKCQDNPLDMLMGESASVQSLKDVV